MLLGLDLGTTNVKALVVSPDGRIVAQGAMPVSLRHVADGGIEQDIEEIWQATLGAIKTAGKTVDLTAVRAIGVSSQGGAIQCRDENGCCIGPVISWMDPRGQPFDDVFQAQVGEQWLTQRIAHGQGGVAVGQLLRMRKANLPPFNGAGEVGFVGDTIVQRLCGRAAHDYSSLSICCVYNPAKQQADPDVLQRLGITSEQLPELLPARTVAGGLKPDVAQATHLRAGIPVSPAVHDQYAAALGCGAIQPGDMMFGAGTAWVLLAIAGQLIAPAMPSSWICDHVVPGRWGQLLSLVVGGSAFKWALDMANLADAPPTVIDETIEAAPPGCDGLRVLPFFDATGGYRRLTSGRVLGLRLAHGRGHLLRATIEGLCLELARQLGWLAQAGCPVSRLIMCGGAARSRVTPQIVADVTGCTVVCPAQSEISSLGAAMLARAIVEPDAAMDAIYRAMTGEAREVHPGPASSAYADMLREYVATVDAASNG